MSECAGSTTPARSRTSGDGAGRDLGSARPLRALRAQIGTLALASGCAAQGGATQTQGPLSGDPHLLLATMAALERAQLLGAAGERDGQASRPELLRTESPHFSASSVKSHLRAADPKCPDEMAFVTGQVCVDRWEASLELRESDGGATPFSPYERVTGFESRVVAVSRPGVVPQGYISGQQAALACKAAGKRLCTAREWSVACRGPSETTFPYGERRIAGACNDNVRSIHPVAELGLKLGVEPEIWWGGTMNHPLINQLPNSVSKTGERHACTNGYGVFDMVGNLHEWIDDPAGTFRGGYYMDTQNNGTGCAYETTAHSFRYHDYSTGFRCCADPRAAATVR